MIFGIIIFVVVFIIAALILYNKFETDTAFMIFASFAFGSIIGCVSMLVSHSIYTSNQKYELVPQSEQEIYSLDTATGISGLFTLGKTSIDSRVIYYYYIENDGFFELSYVDASKARIKQTNDCAPKIVVGRYEPSNYNWFWSFGSDIDLKIITTIYIPEGSIVEHYNANVT